MNTVSDFNEIMDSARSSRLFVRWSRGYVMDKKQGASLDQVSGNRHNGLSCQEVHADRPSLAAQMIVEYRFLQRKDPAIHAWLFRAEVNGKDSDGAPTVDARTIVPVGYVAESLVKSLSDYSDAYWAHRNYTPKTWAEGQEHIRNVPQLSDFLA